MVSMALDEIDDGRFVGMLLDRTMLGGGTELDGIHSKAWLFWCRFNGIHGLSLSRSTGYAKMVFMALEEIDDWRLVGGLLGEGWTRRRTLAVVPPRTCSTGWFANLVGIHSELTLLWSGLDWILFCVLLELVETGCGANGVAL